MAKRAIAVLGAGFGGLRAAKKLGKKLKNSRLEKEFDLYLIDKNDHHTFTPLLYEVATTSKETANFIRLHELAAYKIQGLLKDLPVKFLQKEIRSIDQNGKHIIFSDGSWLDTEYLIIALGAEPLYFDIPGLKENAIPFKSFWDALRIREKVIRLSGMQDDVKIVIGGGGPTGVELAGEIKNWCRELKREKPKCGFMVSVIEGSPNILPGFNKKVSIKARKRLNKLGVRVFENDMISSVLPHEVTLKSGKRLDFDILVWAGGVKSCGLTGSLRFKRDVRGRLLVGPNLKCENCDLKAYAIGDNICIKDPKTQKPLPGIAHAAILEADITVKNLWKDLKYKKHKPRYAIYKPKRYPYVIPIGGKYAIAQSGSFTFSGFPAWVFKGLIEFKYLTSIMPFFKALRLWLRMLFTFINNDRLG